MGRNLTRSLDLVDANRGDAHVPDLGLIAILPNYSQARLQRRLGVDTMKVIELDPVDAKAAQALFDLGAQSFRSSLTRPVPTLGGDKASLRERRKGGPDRQLAVAACVKVSSIDEVDPRAEGLPEERLIGRGVRQPICAQADACDQGVAER